MKSTRNKTTRRSVSRRKTTKISRKGVAKILSVLVVAAILAWFFVFTHLLSNNSTEETSFAAPPKATSNPIQPTSLEAESFSTYTLSGGLQVFDDPSASGGKGMMLSLNTTADGNVTIPGQTSKITATAKSDHCHGGPTMVVLVDDTEAIVKKIPASSWTDYSADFNLPPGSHKVSISLRDDFSTTSGQGCDRTLYVDRLIFQ